MHQVKHFSINVYNLPSVGGKEWRKHCTFSVTASKEVSLLKTPCTILLGWLPSVLSSGTSVIYKWHAN